MTTIYLDATGRTMLTVYRAASGRIWFVDHVARAERLAAAASLSAQRRAALDFEWAATCRRLEEPVAL